MAFKVKAIGLLGSLAFGSASAQAATVIDFDGLSNGDIVTNQFSEVTFSSETGSSIFVTEQSLGASPPNFICSGVNRINCIDDVYLDFTNPVKDLSFLFVGDNNVGDVGDVRVFGAKGLLGTLDLLGDGSISTPGFVEVSGFSNITRIEIANVSDAAGLGFDDFSFSVASTAVPEPKTWALMLLGFFSIGAAMRRRPSLRSTVVSYTQ